MYYDPFFAAAAASQAVVNDPSYHRLQVCIFVICHVFCISKNVFETLCSWRLCCCCHNRKCSKILSGCTSPRTWISRPTSIVLSFTKRIRMKEQTVSNDSCPRIGLVSPHRKFTIWNFGMWRMQWFSKRGLKCLPLATKLFPKFHFAHCKLRFKDYEPDKFKI